MLCCCDNDKCLADLQMDVSKRLAFFCVHYISQSTGPELRVQSDSDESLPDEVAGASQSI